MATLGTTGALWFTAPCFALSAWLLRAMPDDATSRQQTPARLRRAATALWTTPDIRRAATLVTSP